MGGVVWVGGLVGCSLANAPAERVSTVGTGAGGTSASSTATSIVTSTSSTAGAGGSAMPGCGDGVVDKAKGETCDPPSSCMSCEDMDECTVDTTMGSADKCTLACMHEAITACGTTKDGCCPKSCDGKTDLDCAKCGNGMTELGEICDGNCPASCADADACTIDSATGSDATCDLVCKHDLITTCGTKDGCCAKGCTPTTDPDCKAIVTTKDAIDRGWWIIAGNHTASNKNTITGAYQNGSNSFFVFNLAGVTGTVVKASLKMELETYVSSDPSEAMTVWDVSTPIATLIADGTGKTAIFQDLMTGKKYGAFTLKQSDVSTIVPIALDNTVVADLQAALGQQFAIGIHLDDNIGYVRFSAASEQRTHQLILETF
jgi:hypothetical protein